MKSPKLADLFSLILIAVIGLAGTGYFWQYANIVHAMPAVPITAIAQATTGPRVLGVETAAGEKTAPTAATVSFLKQIKILPNQINGLFEKYCQRPVTPEELDQWVFYAKEKLEEYLKNNPLAMCLP